MPAITDSLIISLRADWAALAVLGETPIIPVWYDCSDYTGNIAIHVCNFLDERDKGEAIAILTKAGADPARVPENHFIGWATVKSCCVYDPDRFARERELHLCGNDIEPLIFDPEYPVQRLEITQPHLLTKYVRGRYNNFRHGDLWFPESPTDEMSLKLVLRDIEAIDARTL